MPSHTNKRLIETIERGFQSQRVLVIGDLMLDRYLWGMVEKVSPEAPVPVVRLDHKSHTAGGAANVAANLSSLGCRVSVIGVIGADEDGRQLVELLQSSHIDTSTIFSTSDRPTICKTRILGGRQQMLRLDVEKSGELSIELDMLILSGFEAQVSGCAAIILSDYGKGVLSDAVCQAIIRRGRELRMPIFVDPKGLNYEKYAGCDVISPNRMELAQATSADHRNLELLLQKGQQLRSDLQVGHLVVTLGELGITLLEADGIHRFAARAREVFDVSGAGDTVIATIAAATAAGLHLHEAIRLANLAAEETSQAEKVCTFEALLQRVAHWRVAGERIVFANGCFDLLHVGHLALLEQAKREGDRLVVALNTDRSIRALGMAGRPII